MMEEAPVRFELVDINEILKTLPHRYPMLLIDRVKNIRTDYSGIGIKNVTFNEPPFLGHFPDRPVYPGVMMIEAMAQTAGVIGIKSVEGTEKPRAVYFLTIDKCKFRKPVMPGDTIEYHMRSIGRRKTMWWFHGDAKVDGAVVAEADVGAMLTDGSVGRSDVCAPQNQQNGKNKSSPASSAARRSCVGLVQPWPTPARRCLASTRDFVRRSRRCANKMRFKTPETTLSNGECREEASIHHCVLCHSSAVAAGSSCGSGQPGIVAKSWRPCDRRSARCYR
jgi:3-hydroxyacyl-[acyl-carrier-protein] dehydratase